MRKNVFVALIAAVALLGATAASALDVVVLLNAGGTTIANGYVDNGDGTVTADLTAGDFIVLDVWASNPDAELVSGVFTSLVHNGTLSAYQGGNHFSIFQNATCTGFNCTPPSLDSIGAPGSKPNDPASNATGTDDWIQAIGHTSTFQEVDPGPPGVRGTGPDMVAQLAFSITGAAGFQEVSYVLSEEAGDAVSSGVSSVSYGSLVFNPIPEPGTALLMGLGLMGLGAAGRRK